MCVNESVCVEKLRRPASENVAKEAQVARFAVRRWFSTKSIPEKGRIWRKLQRRTAYKARVCSMSK